MIDFKLPSLGADMEEGTLLQWHVKPGDTVQRGQVVAVVDTSKAAVDVEIWHDGVLAELLVQPGDKVPVGTVLARLLEPGEAAPALATVPAQPAVAAPVVAAVLPEVKAAVPPQAPPTSSCVAVGTPARRGAWHRPRWGDRHWRTRFGHAGRHRDGGARATRAHPGCCCRRRCTRSRARSSSADAQGDRRRHEPFQARNPALLPSRDHPDAGRDGLAAATQRGLAGHRAHAARRAAAQGRGAGAAPHARAQRLLPGWALSGQRAGACRCCHLAARWRTGGTGDP